jgi:hypothetical protein
MIAFAGGMFNSYTDSNSLSCKILVNLGWRYLVLEEWGRFASIIPRWEIYLTSRRKSQIALEYGKIAKAINIPTENNPEASALDLVKTCLDEQDYS